MKTKIRMRALSVILAVMLVSVVVVLAVSADENNLADTCPFGGDPVDKNVVLERSPHLFDDSGNRLSDKAISQMIEEMPEVPYTDGMDEKKYKEIAEMLKQLHKYRSVADSITLEAFPRSTITQADSGIRIDDHHYHGINGDNHPGNLEISSDGTELHYLTSHIGKKMSGTSTWIEVGVAKLSSAFGGDPSEYAVFTYDSTVPENERYVVNQTFTDGSGSHNFEIYISTSQTLEGYPYMILWEGTVIRIGHVPFCFGDVDENHEYFAFEGNSFTPVSEAYFSDSYLSTSYSPTTLWWNDNLQDSTIPHLVGCSAGTPELEYSVPWWSQAYRVRSWIV